MDGKIAIIGDGDSITVFKAVGVDTFKVESGKNCEKQLKKIANDYSVIFVTEQFAEDIKDLLKIFDEKPYPVVLIIPSKNGDTGYGIQSLKIAMNKALGVDILFNN